MTLRAIPGESSPTVEMVTVELQTTATAVYNRIFEMPRSEFEKLSTQLENNESGIEEKLHGLYIRGDQDWMDERDVDVDHLNLFKARK